MKPKKILLGLVGSTIIYLFLSLIMQISVIAAASDKMEEFINQLSYLWWLKIIILIVLWGIIAFATMPVLDIKDKNVGHGQHGDASFMSEAEKQSVYQTIPFGKESEPGLLVGLEDKAWVIDTSDNNMMLLAPPGAGKTTGVYIPTIKYNALVNLITKGNGASLMLVDIKGTLYESTAAMLQHAGYRTPCINLREVFKSHNYNIMDKVNKEIDLYKSASSKKEKAIHYGKAERYAKIAAASIMDSHSKSSSNETSEYFTKTAKGLVIGLMLLIAEYAPKNTRHIISVYDIIIQLSGQDADGMLTGIETTKLASMMKNINNKRIQGYVGAATGADIRTTMNIFSSALGKLMDFVDAELEQLVCSHSAEIDAEKFIEKPTAIFIICPDENPTRHFLASLFIRSFTNDLIELAETKHKGKLPRPFFYMLDEFGNLPAIQDVVSIFSAIRSRNGRILCALQSYAQLLDNYSKDKANIIRDTCQMLMFSFVAPSAEETAKTISTMLGKETILSGSRSVSRSVVTTSSQMVGRDLLTPSQLVKLPFGTFITLKGTEKPYKGLLKGYWQYITLETELIAKPPDNEYKEISIVSPEFIEIAASKKNIGLEKGMFD